MSFSNNMVMKSSSEFQKNVKESYPISQRLVKNPDGTVDFTVKNGLSQDFQCCGKISATTNGNFTVYGKVPTGIKMNSIVRWWAPNPPDFRQSYTGSGLPFPSEEIAFDNTKNQGVVQADANGNFVIRLYYPNGYYVNCGKDYVKPHVNFKICESSTSTDGIFYRIDLPYEIDPPKSLSRDLLPPIYSRSADNRSYH